MTNPIPTGFTAITPFIIAADADRLIQFTQQAFNASVISCLRYQDGSVWNAELEIFGAKILIAGAHGGQQPFPGFIYLYVEDTNSVFNNAVAAGGQVLMEPGDQFFGDRNAGVMDADNNIWWIATRKEDLSSEELEKRARQFEAKQSGQSD